jgi:hypothetical protein
MNLLDVVEKLTVSGGSRTLRARTPGIIAGRRDPSTSHMIVTG